MLATACKISSIDRDNDVETILLHLLTIHCSILLIKEKGRS